MKNIYKKNNGFTLLEVLVCLAIISIALLVILHSHVMNIERASRAKNVLIAVMLAQDKMAQIIMSEYTSLGSSRGDFPDYPGFQWQREIFPTTFENIKRVALLISWPQTNSRKEVEFELYINK